MGCQPQACCQPYGRASHGCFLWRGYEHGWREAEVRVVGGSAGFCIAGAAAVGSLGGKGGSWRRKGSTAVVGAEDCVSAIQPLEWEAWTQWKGEPAGHHCGSIGHPAGEPMQLWAGQYILLVVAGRCPVSTFCLQHSTVSLHGCGSVGSVGLGSPVWVGQAWGSP